MTSASAAAAANFAPYQPPPDHNSSAHGASSASSSQGRPPVPPPTQQEPRQYRDDAYAEEDDVEDDPRYATESYQSGSLGTSQQQQYRQAPYQPTHQQSAASSYQPASSWQTPYPSQTQPDHASYVTSQGISISNLCYAAWALPPFSGVGVLIFETNNVSERKALLFASARRNNLWLARSPIYNANTITMINLCRTLFDSTPINQPYAESSL